MPSVQGLERKGGPRGVKQIGNELKVYASEHPNSVTDVANGRLVLDIIWLNLLVGLISSIFWCICFLCKSFPS